MPVTEYDVGPGAYGGGLAEEISFQPGSEPHGIALGPDGSVWVALETGSLAYLTP